MEHAWHFEAQLVARLGVFLLVQDGLQLVLGRALHVIDIPLGGRADFVGADLLSVFAPFYPAGVVIPSRAVVAQGTFVSPVRVADIHVVVFDIGHFLSVGRGDWACSPFVVHLHPVARVSTWPFRWQRFLFGQPQAVSGCVFNLPAEASIMESDVSVVFFVRAEPRQLQVFPFNLFSRFAGEQCGQCVHVDGLDVGRGDVSVHLADVVCPSFCGVAEIMEHAVAFPADKLNIVKYGIIRINDFTNIQPFFFPLYRQWFRKINLNRAIWTSPDTSCYSKKITIGIVICTCPDKNFFRLLSLIWMYF